MENASKALIIAGAILLSILIIAIGIFVFNGANSTITDSMTSMSTQEIEAFNNQFLSYDGEQSGSNVKFLIAKLIANANTYKEEPNKIPDVYPQKDATSSVRLITINSQSLENYVSFLSEYRNAVENKHTYKVSFEYTSGTGANAKKVNGIIARVTIKYTY